MTTSNLPEVLLHSRVRVVFGAGALNHIGNLAKTEGARHVLLVTDPGIEKAGHADRALDSLREADIHSTLFDRVEQNPTIAHVEGGVMAARACSAAGRPIDLIVGLGGGSAMDCAKGINFIHTNGGRMQDYWGVGLASKPLLPMIAIPTTAGTGSEAQSFALITDPTTHRKMACGDEKALPRIAILDPELTRTQPAHLAAASGIDAVAHAVETAATTRRNEISLAFSREAWVRLEQSFELTMSDRRNDEARADMLLGAYLAGCAIEHSMLGAAHACANPLTARCDIPHGVAVGLMLPHVVEFNIEAGENFYAAITPDPRQLIERLQSMLKSANLPGRLVELNVPESLLEALAIEASEQWTATFNPRPVGKRELLQIYSRAFR